MDMAGGYRPDNVTPDMARVSTAAHERRPDEDAPSAGAADGGLRVQLDAPLPDELAVGAGTAVFVLGWCFSPDAGIRSLDLVVDGVAEPVLAHGMPRLDVFGAMHPGVDPFAAGPPDSDSADDPLSNSYRSGFWGIARIPRAPDRGVCELGLRAQLDDGREAVARLASIPTATKLDPVPVPEAESASGPRVAICMATCDPPLDLFERQLNSIREQTHRNWVCVISDDCSTPERFAAVRDAVGDDARFVISRSPGRLGFYRNFERALALVPAGTAYVAMADQDDVWHPDKLEVLLGAIGDAQLVYSDARIVGRDGELISETYWGNRRNNHASLLSLLVANSVTGAASLFPTQLLDHALPFPPAQFAHYHDHWIALTALALGEIAFTERSVYDYVQHREAALGHTEANRVAALRRRFGSIRSDPRERGRAWRAHYFADVCRLLQFATVLRMRCGERMAPAKRRTLDRFLRTDRSLLRTAGLWLRGVGEVIGRPETLGAEWKLSYAFAWRHAAAAAARDRPRGRLRLDALPPSSLAPKRAHPSPAAPGPREVIEKITPLELAVRDDSPPRVNILIPTIDLEHLFGGYIAKFNLARRLAERGARVRIVTVDRVGPLPRSWRRDVEAYSGLAGLFDRVEIEFGRESQGIEVSRDDRFVATTWWSAHIAADAVRFLGGGRFVYLIQEYEPFTFPMGTFAALATESYGFPHHAVFSTEFLRDYFRRHGIGVYAEGTEAGDAASVAFQNAITPIEPPTIEELAGRRSRRLLFYARPEPHAARNMFDLGLLALGRAIEVGGLPRDWELHGIGTLASAGRIDLGFGAGLKLLRRSPQEDYAALLRSYDVGLALMYTPHPSLVPIEMASAGMLTVTNSFENKTPEALAEISGNLVAGEPTIDGIAAGLREAVAGVEDAERRVRGSEVRWSRDWNASFDDELLARLASVLQA
jgi:glycosyltransferase involved in cell wall biosynthesis